MVDGCFIFVDVNFVVLVDYVIVEDGIGLVYQVLVFGVDDLQICCCYGLLLVNLICFDGIFEEFVLLVGGQFFKIVDKLLCEDFDRCGVLFCLEMYWYFYLYCWCCDIYLIYYVQFLWYICMMKVKE